MMVSNGTAAGVADNGYHNHGVFPEQRYKACNEKTLIFNWQNTRNRFDQTVTKPPVNGMSG
ncbi:hypothetical protein ADQ49_26645 [Salmonella enterica subsp. enterica]|nr:hypothetical protein [Salmonella enterica subsp. enterica serovar Enteritidis]